MRADATTGTGEPERWLTISATPIATAVAAISPKRISFAIPESSGSARRTSANEGRNEINELVAVPSEILAGPNASGLAILQNLSETPHTETEQSHSNEDRSRENHSDPKPIDRVGQPFRGINNGTRNRTESRLQNSR